MDTKALKTLEYTKILKMLEGRAISPMGKAFAMELLPSATYFEVAAAQHATSEALGLIVKRGSLPLGGIRDISRIIERAERAGILTIEELSNVADCLYVAQKVLKYWHEPHGGSLQSGFSSIAAHFNSITHPEALEREILRCILPPSEMADKASPELAQIRRNINSANERIREQLSKIVHSGDFKNMLQDNVVTMRGNRFVVPIKQEYRNSFAGIVHDQSSSGSTLFIEPAAVVDMNNRIKELYSEEKAEIEKILRRLSQYVAEHSEEIRINQEAIAKLDFIFAKGELSLEMNAREPILNTRPFFDIRKGRHPLLAQGSAVPIDIHLGDAFSTLLITGPNTGGKTVALKTLGLFTLMCQAGLHIPAAEGSGLPVMDNVFADIGDEQSIEQSLSTFSSHMTNIVSILSRISDNSLVLLDELGAGTDPTEGAALAIAIIEVLLSRKILTAVTTHYSELKVFALGEKGVENASCEFDVETLRPTYRLLIGVPGKSNAFAISKKLGLSQGIIKAAQDKLSSESAKFEDVLTDLEISRKNMNAERARAESFREEAERLRQEAQTQRDKLAAQRDKIIHSARAEARAIIQEAKNIADTIVKELRKSTKNTNFNHAEKLRAKLGDALRNAQEPESVTPSNNRGGLRPSEIAKGDAVFIHSIGRDGSIAGDIEPGGRVLVQAGSIKLKVPLAELSRATTAQVTSPKPAAVFKPRQDIAAVHEINLLGCTVDEALERTDKYLDTAYLSGLGQARIIHGKGTGALKNAIHAYLRSHPLAQSYRLGGQGEGDTGVTIVEFRK